MINNKLKVVVLFLLLGLGLFAREAIYIFVHDHWLAMSRTKELNEKISAERKKLNDPNIADTFRIEALRFLSDQGDLQSVAKSRQWLLSPNRSYRLSILQTLATSKASIDAPALIDVAKKFPNSDESRLAAQVLGSRLSQSSALSLARTSSGDLRFRVELILSLISNSKDATLKEPLIEEVLKMSAVDPSVLTYVILSLNSEVRTSTALGTTLRTLAKNPELTNEQKMAVLESLALAPQHEDREFWDQAAASQDEQLLKIAVTRANRFCSPKLEESLHRITQGNGSADLKSRANQKLEQIKRENLCPTK